MLKKKAYNTKLIKIPEHDIDQLNLNVEFIFKSTYVRSVDNKTIEFKSITTIEDYDSCNESARYARSEQLVCLGILCFFTHIPFTVYDSEQGSSNVNFDDFSMDPKNIEPKFISEVKDFSGDLKKLLHCLETNTELSVTIIDRIRKGLYLERESDDANLHHDEAFLIYFGIVEMLTDHFTKDYKMQLETSVKNMLNKFYSENSFYNVSTLKEKTTQKYKLLHDVMISEELNLKNRMLFMCKKLNLNHIFLESFVGDIIKQRNKVAHGRTIYNDKFIWPLPPFFSSLGDSTTKLYTVYCFMINIAHRFFELDSSKESYEMFENMLLPTNEFIKQLLSEPKKYSFSKEELISGNEYNFTFATIFYLWVHSIKNISIDEIATVIGNEFLISEIDEENGQCLFNISILFADSSNVQIREKASENIKKIVKKTWYDWSNIKDALRYLDYYEVKFKWFKEWIQGGGHIKCNDDFSIA